MYVQCHRNVTNIFQWSGELAPPLFCKKRGGSSPDRIYFICMRYQRLNDQVWLSAMMTFLLHLNIYTTGLSKHLQDNKSYSALHFARDSVAYNLSPESARCLVLACKCISLTTMFVHTALLFWSIPSVRIENNNVWNKIIANYSK